MSTATDQFEAADLGDCDWCTEPATTVVSDAALILCRPHYTELLRADQAEQDADSERDAA